MTPLFSELFDRLGTWLIFALWQSTLLLGTAILLRRLFWRSPWRSHVLLTLGIISAAIAPTFSTIVAFQNGGLLGSGNFWRSDIFESLILRSGWLGLLLMFGAVMFATLLGYGILTSRRLMFRARPFPDRESQEALLRSAKMLKHVSLPILFTSDGVKSPTVWCWGLHPAVLLPETLTKKLSAEERDAIFLHELAHISRRDHFSALATRICGAFLFWNPLYWLALWQNDLASDQACDLLVLSQGTVLPEQYTETLLRLAAGEKRRPAFQFLSRKEKMMKRINTILDFAEHASKFPVRTQPLWTGSVVSLALLTCVVLAFCQEKKNDEASKVKFDTYSVMKKVGEFPDGDLSTPEAAYSTYNKTMASKDKDIIAKLKEYDFNKKMKIPQREIDNIVNMPDDWANILKTATVKEVYLCGDMAKAVAFLDGENTQKAYDTRSFRKVDGKWLNEGNDRVDSLEEAAKKFADRIQKAASKTGENSGEIVTSLEKFLKVEGLKRYPVKKRIADFPADAIDLSSPEKSYATQKNLIISNREDKFEQLSNMTAGRPKISERERKGMEEKIPEDQAQTWREEFVVFEMFVLNDKYAFVFGFRQSDDLYDGNYFVKQGDEWLNAGNEQSMGAEEIAKRVQTVFSRRAKVLQALTSPDSEAVTSYEVNKKVTDFPTDQIDLSTPESAYVLITRTMTGDAPDKLETLALYTLGRIKVPESGQKFIENMPDEYRESQKNARIVKVLVYKNSSAMVIAELENPKSFYFLWMKKDDNNHWLTFGNGTVKNINDAEKAFHAAVERWDKEKEPWKSPDNVGHTHLFTFAGKGSFKPQTPKELLDKLNESLFKTQVVTGYFRTWPEDGRLVGSICTNDPGGLKNVLSAIPDLELIKAEPLNEKLFKDHTAKGQLSLGNGTSNQEEKPWKSPDNVGHTHLFTFAGKGSFKPQTPKELLDKLNESLFKTQVVTGYFRTWPEDGRLVGSICTNDPGGLKNVISAIPDLELIKAEPLDEKLFHEHTVKGQQSLGGGASNPKAAPTIAKMEPANGAEDVDADAVKELRVTFDRDMNTGGFSWTGGGDDYPKTTGSPKWIDKRTCVLPVQLEVGKKYRLGINSMRFKNFQSAEGVPVEPVVYTFGTK